MKYALVAVPAAPVRRKPNHRLEMVNQLLFGECVRILREKGKLWVKVQSLHDGYEGWMTRTLLEPVNDRIETGFLTGGMINNIQLNGLAMNLPGGCNLPDFDGKGGMLGKLRYSTTGDIINRHKVLPSSSLLEDKAHQWINAPYLWGGRTIFGVDCSGFVQMNFKMIGIDLPRDAWQQAQQGINIKKLRLAVKGDLAFFDDRQEIVHVGLLLDSTTIIHASGKVRIDKMDRNGIIHSETGKRTHQLRAIRRILQVTD